MACSKTTKCGCPGFRCRVPSKCMGITISKCGKTPPKKSKARRKTSCAAGKTRAGTGRCHFPKSKAMRKTPPKKSKARRKSPCSPGKTRAGTGRCHLPKSRRKSPKGKSKARISRGWANQSPNTHQRTVMLKNCGKKCFMGPDKSFPICTKNTCKVNNKGLHAAYVRSKQYKGSNQETYQKIARSAKSRLSRQGYLVQ